MGRAEDALASIADGFDVIAETREHWTEPEIHRVRGELHASLSQASEAETAFTTALAIAVEKGAGMGSSPLSTFQFLISLTVEVSIPNLPESELGTPSSKILAYQNPKNSASGRFSSGKLWGKLWGRA